MACTRNGAGLKWSAPPLWNVQISSAEDLFRACGERWLATFRPMNQWEYPA